MSVCARRCIAVCRLPCRSDWAGLEGKPTFCPPYFPAWVPLSCLQGKRLAALRSELQCIGVACSALEALPAMWMGPGTSGFIQSALSFCSYCNQDSKQTMLAGSWTLLVTRAAGSCRQSGFGLSPGCLKGQFGWEREGFHSSGKCMDLQDSCGGVSQVLAQYVEPQTTGNTQRMWWSSLPAKALSLAAPCPTAVCKERCYVPFIYPKDALTRGYRAEGLWRHKSSPILTCPFWYFTVSVEPLMVVSNYSAWLQLFVTFCTVGRMQGRD